MVGCSRYRRPRQGQPTMGRLYPALHPETCDLRQVLLQNAA